jgi:hypothetical protein
MSYLQKITLYAALAGDLAALIVLAFAIPSYLANRDALVKMQTTINLLNKRMEDRKVETDQKVATVEEKRVAVKTPAQAVQSIQEFVPGVKIILADKIPTIPSVIAVDTLPNELPDAPSAVISPESLFALNNRLADCQKDQIKLGACEKDKQDLAEQVDVATRAAKGGTFWRRLKTGLKVTACAGAGGGVGSIKGAQGAAVGAAAGAMLCSIF